MSFNEEHVRFNHIQGITPSRIPAYSNEDDDFISFEGAYIYGIFTGFKWQCVEFARRWLLLRKSCIFPSIASAADIWFQLTDLERVTDGRKFPIRRFPNGSTNKPQVENFILYHQTAETPFGHIAVISEVHEDFIRVVEQNYRFHCWKGNFAREIPLVFRNGLYFLEDHYQIFGWIDFVDKEQMKPLDHSKAHQILKKYQETKRIGQLERFIKFNDETKFVYCKADEDFLVSLSSTSNELYRLFQLATDHVIKNDHLLREFAIPQAFWSAIRRSWSEEYHSDILGHLDLKFDGISLKLNDYQSDSALLLIQSDVWQEKCAEQLNLDYNLTSAFQLHRLLVRHWRRLHIENTVHIIINDEREEMVTALYMQTIMTEASIPSKLCRLNVDFYWNNSTIVDSEGVPVKIVWSLWKWEKIFQEYQESNDDDHPSLIEILLDPEIRIIEPLWKSITTHRAIHHILYNMFPNHPNLVYNHWMAFNEDSETMPMVKWSSDEQLQTDDENQLMDLDRDLPVKKSRDEKIVSWMVRGLFSGFSVRENSMKNQQPIVVCCVV